MAAAREARKERQNEAERRRRAEEQRKHDEEFKRMWEEFFGSSQKQTCWTILGLQPPVTVDDLKIKYRKLAKEHHPDLGGNAQKFVNIKKAYDEASRLITR